MKNYNIPNKKDIHEQIEYDYGFSDCQRLVYF